MQAKEFKEKMGAYKYIQQTFEKEVAKKSPEYKERIMKYRRQGTLVRLEKPTNLKRARELGYKAKQGFVVVRAKVRRGARKKPKPRAGRRPKRMGITRITAAKSKQAIAEERVARRFPNLEVLNSYWIAEDGSYKWFEVILVDPHHPAIRNDSDISWISSRKHRGRTHRGLTSAGKKGRGQRKKGKGTEKTRPSIRARGRKGK
jgi:large subunit ribosomal protein L15e